MTKITRIKDTEIRRVWECYSNGEKVRLIGIIGKVSELLEKEIIFDDNTDGNMDKWLLIIDDGDTIKEFDSVDAAKEYARKEV